MAFCNSSGNRLTTRLGRRRIRLEPVKSSIGLLLVTESPVVSIPMSAIAPVVDRRPLQPSYLQSAISPPTWPLLLLQLLMERPSSGEGIPPPYDDKGGKKESGGGGGG